MPTARQNLQFHLRRALQERRSADSASDASARESHLRLAEAHAGRAANITERLDAQVKPTGSDSTLRMSTITA